MSSRTIFLLIAIFSIGSSSHAQLEGAYSDSFIAEQLRNAKNTPNNQIVFEVNQPIDIVFTALLSELPNYSDEVLRLTFDNSKSLIPGKINLGSRRISVMKNEERLVQKIIKFDPPNSFAYFTEMSQSTVNVPLDYSVGYYHFTEHTKGETKIKVSTVYKASSRLTGFLVRLGFKRAFNKDFEKAEMYLNSIQAK
jgi:hypothetical protein